MTSTDVVTLVDKITPVAMERIRQQIRQTVASPTAFPKEMFVAIEFAFRSRLQVLFTAHVKHARGYVGRWVDELVEGRPTEGLQRDNPEVWALGEAAADDVANSLTGDLMDAVRNQDRDG